MGMAGVLDSARYRLFVAQAAGVSVENVEALVLGGHGGNFCCYDFDSAGKRANHLNNVEVRVFTFTATFLTAVLVLHADDMVPIRSCCRIAGMPVTKFLSEKVLDEIEIRTRKAGAEVVGLLGIGSAFVSPAWSALEMAESIIYDKKKILASCVLLEGVCIFCFVCVVGVGGKPRTVVRPTFVYNLLQANMA